LPEEDELVLIYLQRYSKNPDSWEWVTGRLWIENAERNVWIIDDGEGYPTVADNDFWTPMLSSPEPEPE
jgi:hypothetical protein